MGTADDIRTLWRSRAKRYDSAHTQMQAIHATYYGDINVDLPESDTMSKPPVPNLLQQGIDQLAGRVTSTIPQIRVLPKSEKRTDTRRATTAERVYTGWWAADRTTDKLKRRARHLLGYGMTTAVVSWNFNEHRPKWEVRSPLSTFPDPDIEPESPHLGSVVHSYQRSVGWLRANGYAISLVDVLGQYDTPTDEQLMTVLDYHDENDRFLILVGYDRHSGAERASIMAHYPHNLGITPATIGLRSGLDRLSGQFDQMLSMYETQARLMALEILAIERGIFPDTYLVSNPNEAARILDGPHDGRSGKITVVAGGRIQTENVSPGYLTQQTIDRVERNQRVTGRLPAEFGGEAASNIRTGRRGDALLSATIDMDVADAQDTLARCLAVENEIAARLARKYDAGNSRTIFVSVGAADKSVTYEAESVFKDTLASTVTYPASGADINQLIVGVGQRVGLGTMSRQTAAELDPLVDSPEVEHDRIIVEGLEQALLAGIQQQASSGAIPPLTLAKVMQMVGTDKMELAEALNKVTEEAMAQQQAEQQQMTPEMAMAGPTAAAMTGNPDPLSPVPGVGAGMDDLSSMLGALRTPMMGIENRVGVEGAM